MLSNLYPEVQMQLLKLNAPTPVTSSTFLSMYTYNNRPRTNTNTPIESTQYQSVAPTHT